MTRGVEIIDYSIDQSIGHYTFHLRGVEIDDAQNRFDGPTKTYGIDAAAMLSIYANDIQAFVTAQKAELLALLDSTRSMATVMPGLKGAIL